MKERVHGLERQQQPPASRRLRHRHRPAAGPWLDVLSKRQPLSELVFREHDAVIDLAHCGKCLISALNKDPIAYLGMSNVAIFSVNLDSFDFKMQTPEDAIKSVMVKLARKGKGSSSVDMMRRSVIALPAVRRPQADASPYSGTLVRSSRRSQRSPVLFEHVMGKSVAVATLQPGAHASVGEIKPASA